MADNKDRNQRAMNKETDENRDPISGAPGAHPVGTGVGAAVGGVAGAVGTAAAVGAATGTVVGGPVGTALGGVVGAVVGGLAGKGVAEKMNPTAEEAYWKEQYAHEPYYDQTYSYDDYRGAYRTGYEGYGKWGSQGKTYDEVEPSLRSEYERNYGKSKLGWDKASPATRAAWERFNRERESQGLNEEMQTSQPTRTGSVSGNVSGEEGRFEGSGESLRRTPAEEIRERGSVPRSQRRTE